MDRSEIRAAIPKTERETQPETRFVSYRLALCTLASRVENALTTETLIYVVLVIAAAASRFWDLGSRALHHDESVHSFTSWTYSQGGGYIHDPMFHGPLLYHLNALVFKLFGATDYTTRLIPALMGTLLVAMPFLLRKQLGRVSMLVTSFLLLITPEIWYYGRFIRNDIHDAFWTMMIFVGLVRWMDSRNPRWFHFAWVGWVLLFCQKEVSFIALAIFGSFLIAVLLLAQSRTAFAWLIAYAVGALVAVRVLPHVLGWPGLPSIPYNNPSFEKSLQFTQALLTSSPIVTLVIWTVVWLVGLWIILRRADVFAELGRIARGEKRANALTTAFAVMPRKWMQLLIVVAEFLIIAVPLYTSLFTNLKGGIMSGSFGQLFYWLAQQNVRRGDQPWFYYLVMDPVYSPLVILFGSAGIVYGAYWALRRWRGATRPGTFVIAYALLVYWSAMSLFIYSWAGEKMPWLSVELLQPFLILGAVFGVHALRLEEGRYSPFTSKRGGAWVFALVALLISGWTYYKMSSWSLQSNPTGQSPLVYGLIALVVLSIVAIMWLGARSAGRSLGLVAIAVLAIYTVRSGMELNYYHGDVPVEQQIYVQTSPYVPSLMRAITSVSSSTAGGKQASIIYDSDTSWPFVWYLKDFKNAQFMPDGPTSPPRPNVEFILLGLNSQNKAQKYLGNYVAFQYPMRWWFPEEMYRRLDDRPNIGQKIQAKGTLNTFLTEIKYIGKGIAAWGNPHQQAMLWRYLMYRKVDGTIYSFDMVVYVRRDLVGKFNSGRLQG